ncbi:unnamed protein product [Penicillium salamii]|uniref:histone acetyltransferase n=1 Tax=Penicillium salamii TaxID=1612424 RepID=A0A9W4JRA9_9EURO|nr:unnamed protein product [Penicillium salamii]CAG8397401.1 unnamed protein product [Penicillium salamii]CAG8416558.1 unnamed protein product [Penicillium salamii]CAG8421834.1 unnamed protein product [Penicillium salamii]
MDLTESDLPALVGDGSFGAKRPASKEPSPSPDAKKPHPDVQMHPESQTVPYQDKPAVVEERNGDIEIRVVHNDRSPESTVTLTGIKCLFQSQLPQMPKKYITRLVFDSNHLSMAIVKMPLEVVGGITYREFRDRKLAEIVFCAISPDHQVKGYGSHLMNHFKDYLKASSPIMHMLTYADNYAVGYFQKQGFTKQITLDEKIWKGIIKDYEGGKLMQCTMIPRIRYLEAARMLHKQKESVKAKIRTFNQNHVIHQPPEQWATKVTPIDPLSIPAIRTSGWSPEMDEFLRATHRQSPAQKLRNELRSFLNQIQNHKHAWPFLKPVNKEEVTDYYDVIKNPIDLGTMEEILETDVDHYATPQDMVNDLKLMFNNCRFYNDPTSPYYKCADAVEKYMWKLVNEVPEWHKLVLQDQT